MLCRLALLTNEGDEMEKFAYFDRCPHCFERKCQCVLHTHVPYVFLLCLGLDLYSILWNKNHLL